MATSKVIDLTDHPSNTQPQWTASALNQTPDFGEFMGIEKRRYRRLETNLPARMKDLSDPEGTPFDVTIVNLGPEGAFASSEQLLNSQTEISLSFRLDSYPMEINVIAKVLWRKEGSDQDGMGMCFTHIPLFEKNIIIDYILRRYAEHQARSKSG